MFISRVLLKQNQEAEHRLPCPTGVVLQELTAATGTTRPSLCPARPQPGLSSGLLEYLLHRQLQGAAAAAPREGRQGRAERSRSKAAEPWQEPAVRAPCRARAARAVCSKIALNMTRGVGWARERWLSPALPLPRACLHCHMLLCRILHRALFVIL